MCKFGFVLVKFGAVSRLKLAPALRVMPEPTTKLRRGRYLFHPQIESRALLGDTEFPQNRAFWLMDVRKERTRSVH